MKILITGTAGFIGFHSAREFMRRNWEVVGIDNFNDYYDIRLKLDRDELLRKNPKFKSHGMDICDFEKLQNIFAEEQPDVVLNLAAQPGVPTKPQQYIFHTSRLVFGWSLGLPTEPEEAQ